jgi:hypothetical protein
LQERAIENRDRLALAATDQVIELWNAVCAADEAQPSAINDAMTILRKRIIDIRNRKLENFIKQKQKQRTWRTIHTWNTKKRKENLEYKIMLRVVQRASCRGMASAFAAWAKDCEVAARSKGVQMKILKRMQQRELSLALDRWRSSTSEAVRGRRLMMRVVQRASCRGMASAFAAWAKDCEVAARSKGVQMKILKRMQQRELSLALDRWRSSTSEAVRGMLLIHRMLLRGSKRSLSAGFENWRRYTDFIVWRTQWLYSMQRARNLEFLVRIFEVWSMGKDSYGGKSFSAIL